MTFSLGVQQQERMLATAQAALKQAYAPYSHFRVGAAVLSESGSLYKGCNVENASYGLTICAERAAICAAIANEGSDLKIKAIAVCTEHAQPCPPCGACRQFIFEFGPEAVVLFRGLAGLEQTTISLLLPAGFRLL